MQLPSCVRTAASLAARHRMALGVAGVLLLALLGLGALRTLLHSIRAADIRHAFDAIAVWRIAAALALTGVSYTVLTFYDVFALRAIGRPLPYRTAALASFTSYSLSNNLGLSVLTGGSARYYVYSASGLTAGEVARVVVIAGLTFWCGIVALAGAALAFHPVDLPGVLSLPHWLQTCAGVAILILLVTSLAATRQMRKHGWDLWGLPKPEPRTVMTQVLLAAADLSAACGALFVLVPDLGPAMFPALLLAYIVAIVATLISHVPGGLGVFEAVVIALMPDMQRADLVAALLAYRAIYYLLPLILAALVLLVSARRRWGAPVAGAVNAAQGLLRQIAPPLLSALCFCGGAILLISGSVPPAATRLHALRHILPLPFVEASHIAASLAGTGLLLLAPGLYRRLDGAFVAARALLVAGAAFALIKGLDVEQAVILLAIAAILQGARRAFYRRTALAAGFSAQWVAAIAVVAAVMLWAGFFSYRHVPYSNTLWWQFAWRGEASRFLRASFAVTVLLGVVLLARLLRPVGPVDRAEGMQDRDIRVLAGAVRTDAMLMLTGDKRLLRSESGEALLMYQVQGRSWIVMGDPIGPVEEWSALLWRIRELADAQQGRLLLYQLSASALPVAIDLGLQLIKYGEEARVSLPAFSLDGPGAKSLRAAARKAERQGITFEVVPAAQLGPLLPSLRRVSDAWLAMKGGHEKSFSIGRFDPGYIARFDCAVVRCHGEIVAFANIWKTATREELSVDLMRHVGTMPNGTMDYLFIELIRWGQAQGYRWFTLGLAPLSGIEARPLAPLWARAAGFLYRHGDAFYRFEGLRAYKQKFSPEWEPRYIAAGGGLGFARSLLDLQTLVGGGRASAANRCAGFT